MKIKILSWNIWAGKYLDKVIETLKKENADIIGLQEVTEEKIDNQKINIAYKIAKELKYEAIFFKAFSYEKNGRFFNQGNAILSKFPIKKSKVHFLSNLNLYKKTAQTEPRIAVEIEVNINNTNLYVFTTHLAYADKFESS